MTTFSDGPAAGQTLMLKRCAKFLRVTELLGAFDALDQPDDQPEPGETLHAYVCTGAQGSVHIDSRDKQGRRVGHWYPIAQYKICDPQPSQEEMKDADAWHDWCVKNDPNYPS